LAALSNGHQVILSVYVDNLIIIGRPDDVDAVKKKLAAHFKLKDLGPVLTILGICIIHDRINNTLDLSQPAKITELAEEYGLSKCKLLSSLLPAGCELAVLETTPFNCLKLHF
jgi:hypothetical protein